MLIKYTKYKSLKSFEFIKDCIILLMIISIILLAELSHKYPHLQRRSLEGATKFALGKMRTSIMTYKDIHKEYPLKLEDMKPSIISEVQFSRLKVKYYGKGSNSWKYDPTPDTPIKYTDIDNSTTWIYNNKLGEITINNNSTDTKGTYCYKW